MKKLNMTLVSLAVLTTMLSATDDVNQPEQKPIKRLTPEQLKERTRAGLERRNSVMELRQLSRDIDGKFSEPDAPREGTEYDTNDSITKPGDASNAIDKLYKDTLSEFNQFIQKIKPLEDLNVRGDSIYDIINTELQKDPAFFDGFARYMLSSSENRPLKDGDIFVQGSTRHNILLEYKEKTPLKISDKIRSLKRLMANIELALVDNGYTMN